MMKKVYFVIPMLCALLFSSVIYGQDDYSRLIQNYMERNLSTYGLSESDVTDLEITDRYYTESLGLEHVYAQQQINGIPVFNAIGSFAIKRGEVAYFSNNFENNLYQRTNSASPSIRPLEAISKALAQLKLGNPENIQLLSSENGHYLFSGGGVSQMEIPVELVYQPVGEESIRLSWDLSIQTLDGRHWWSLRVDAKTGEIISKNDWVVSCSFEPAEYNLISGKVTPKTPTTVFGRAEASILGDGSQYEVFPLPIESPNQGVRSIVSEPADLVASPHGWHDVNGTAGADYTTTRGSNVFAYENRDGDSNFTYSPDGGNALDFTFPLDLTQTPDAYVDAAVTNLFYMNNIMHDVWYHYGFDEASGNFQGFNYTSSGLGSDYVQALAQDGADNGPGNNATFGTPPDGINPLMRMFTWQYPGAPRPLTIYTPSDLGGSYFGIPADFGPAIPSTGVSGELALIEDDNSGTSTDPNDGCDNITNGPEISGKIAVIRRGICQFDEKVKNAQDEGAIAAIVVNNVANELVTMSGDDATISIPSIFLRKEEGDPIIAALLNGESISAMISLPSGMTAERDGDIDNSVIMHEYGHGISNRLTGGPSQAGCLNNDEQMGEGWSDFFGLVMTMEPGDNATDPRGYASYVLFQENEGAGLREHPYTTDMDINPFTYADVQNQMINTPNGPEVSSHGVGTIWATMLWDLTWALVNKYGFDPDLYNGTGGNNIAMQLVIDGMKLQGCSPGFIDGRDAILQADLQTNAGANQCLIWCVFSRRGLGYSADQGQSSSINDQIAAFDMPPSSVLPCASCPNLRTSTPDMGESFFQIYPNPANDLVNIASNKIKGEVQVTLFDMNGRKIMEKALDLNNNAQINVSGLNSGIYVLHITSDGKTQTEKLIVQ